MSEQTTLKPMIRIKGKGILSAESIVTVRAGVTYNLVDEPEPPYFQVMITAPASDLELFLLPFADDKNAELEVEILNIIQPQIGSHDQNLKWLDYVIQRQLGEEGSDPLSSETASVMNKEQRDQQISEVSDAMETGDATTDDWWDAIFSSLEWCEYELKQLGFHSNYDELYEMLGDTSVEDIKTFQEAECQFRTVTPESEESEPLGWDDRATVITALRYRERYKESGGKRVYFGTMKPSGD